MRVRALVISHSDMLRTGLIHDLARSHLADFHFTEVRHARLALAAARIDGHDVVFIEWHAASGGTPAFVRQFRVRDPSGTPIVAVATEAASATLDPAFEAGLDYCMIRPLSPEAVERKLGPLIARMRAERQARGALV